MKFNIVGAGGHSRSLIGLVLSLGHEVSAVFDDSYSAKDEEIYPRVFLKGSLKDIPQDSHVLFAVGDNIRRSALSKIHKGSLVNLIHKTSVVESTVLLGNGNQIFANSVVNSMAKIGDLNILNTSCVIEHEVVIGDFNHVSVNTVLAGRVKIGNHCFIGANATVIDGVSICDNVIVGAGAVVINDITEPGTYVGVPAVKV